MKSFKHWKMQEVEETFEVREIGGHPLLTEWMSISCELSENERIQLEDLRLLLKKNVNLWNEAELKFKFLGPLLALAKYDNDNYRAFMERSLTVKSGEETASGTVDFLIAKGRQIPRSPFFCIHEHKPDPSSSNDPLGQLLIGLEAIRQENASAGYNFPLYGAYVVGRFFYFVVFDGKTYAKSEPYVASQDDIFDIFCFLKQVKVYIDAIIAEEQQ
ncbi:MAG: hypothetical protein AAF847_12870 [Bacteroidota bacterium]